MIRKIECTDKEIYFKMSEQFYASGAALSAIGNDKREAFWPEILKDVFVHGYICEHGGECAGYALTVPYASQEFGGTVLWIDELFVLPEFRGLGIAKEFLRYAEKLSGNVMLRLEVEKDNERAVKIYGDGGFGVLPYIQMIKNT